MLRITKSTKECEMEMRQKSVQFRFDFRIVREDPIKGLKVDTRTVDNYLENDVDLNAHGKKLEESFNQCKDEACTYLGYTSF